MERIKWFRVLLAVVFNTENQGKVFTVSPSCSSCFVALHNVLFWRPSDMGGYSSFHCLCVWKLRNKYIAFAMFFFLNIIIDVSSIILGAMFVHSNNPFHWWLLGWDIVLRDMDKAGMRLHNISTMFHNYSTEQIHSYIWIMCYWCYNEPNKLPGFVFPRFSFVVICNVLNSQGHRTSIFFLLVKLLYSIIQFHWTLSSLIGNVKSLGWIIHNFIGALLSLENTPHQTNALKQCFWPGSPNCWSFSNDIRKKSVLLLFIFSILSSLCVWMIFVVGLTT